MAGNVCRTLCAGPGGARHRRRFVVGRAADRGRSAKHRGRTRRTRHRHCRHCRHCRRRRGCCCAPASGPRRRSRPDQRGRQRRQHHSVDLEPRHLRARGPDGQGGQERVGRPHRRPPPGHRVAQRHDDLAANEAAVCRQADRLPHPRRQLRGASGTVLRACDPSSVRATHRIGAVRRASYFPKQLFSGRVRDLMAASTEDSYCFRPPTDSAQSTA